MRASSRDVVCKTEQTKAMVNLGGGFRYIWRDTSGAVIGEATVDSC
jgi:hypothetical protein